MGFNTNISWAHNSFNGWLGCIEYGEDCVNCYAREFVKNRMGKPGLWGPAKTTERQVTTDTNWKKPLAWNRLSAESVKAGGERHRTFAFSLSDWAENHPTAAANRPRLFRLIRTTRDMDWLLLTKRGEDLEACLPPDWGDGYPNVWLGVSCGSMKGAARVDALRRIPAAVRWISNEPSLGPVDDLDLTGIDWVVEGAESGAHRRAYDLAWPRSMRDRCRRDGRPLWRKQGSAFMPDRNVELDGEIIHELPTPRPLSWAPIFGGGPIAQGTFLV